MLTLSDQIELISKNLRLINNSRRHLDLTTPLFNWAWLHHGASKFRERVQKDSWSGEKLQVHASSYSCSIVNRSISVVLRSLAKQQGREIPSEPILFLKPTTAFLEAGGNIEVR